MGVFVFTTICLSLATTTSPLMSSTGAKACGFIRRFQAHAALGDRDFHLLDAAADEEFRAQIGDAALADHHHEGTRGIVGHLEIGLAAIQRHAALIAAPRKRAASVLVFSSMLEPSESAMRSVWPTPVA